MSHSKIEFPSTNETTNLARIDRMLLGPCKNIMCTIFAKLIDPPDLSKKVYGLVKHGKIKLTDDQQNVIKKQTYSDFDLTLLCLLFRNVCNIKPHRKSMRGELDPLDRSMQANIERIRLIRNKKGHWTKTGFKNSEYEQMCDDIYDILCDLGIYLETYPDLANDAFAYANSVKKIRKDTMDPEQKRDLNNRNQTLRKRIHHLKATRNTWTEPVKSKQLKEQFNSFQVKIDNYHDCPFVSKIFAGDFITELEIEIKSLAQGVYLVKDIPRTGCLQPMDTVVHEVEVTVMEKKLCVKETEDGENFFGLAYINQARVILITCHSIHSVDAKLRVYREFTEQIDTGNIFLHHEYEDFDEVAQFSAFHRLCSYSDFIESVIMFFEKDLFSCLEQTLSQDKITRCICETKDETVGTFKVQRAWKKLVFEEINMILSEHEESDAKAAMAKIKYMSSATVGYLNVILSQLHEFQKNLVDQRKEIKEWCKREILEDITVLLDYPSYERHIVGYRDDDKRVVKLFLNKDDENVKTIFKSCIESDDTKFEFVNTQKRAKKEEDSELREEETKNPLDSATLCRLQEIISNYDEKFAKLYSNFTAMAPGNARREGSSIRLGPCIILYCLDKTITPYGEHPLPEFLEELHCDIREDYTVFTKCCNNCKFVGQNSIQLGCSIGIPSENAVGSVGFLVEPRTQTDTFRCGFLTASHVAIDMPTYKKLYISNDLLSTLSSLKESHFVVHPSFLDNNYTNNIVGEVVESFCGKYGSSYTGLDIAVVKCNSCTQKGEKEILQVVKEDNLHFGEDTMVIKTGRGTGTTYGHLKGSGLTVKVNSLSYPNAFYIFRNCYAVEDGNAEPFFGQGDSGSGVFMIDRDGRHKPLGIAFSRLHTMTAVCKIDEFLDEIDLNIVRYYQNTLEITEDRKELIKETQEVTNDAPEPNMDATELIKDTQELTEDTPIPIIDTQKLTENTKEPIMDKRELIEDTQELNEDTQELNEDTQEPIMDTRELIEDTQELNEDTQEPVMDTWELNKGTQDLTEDTQEITESTEELSIHKN